MLWDTRKQLLLDLFAPGGELMKTLDDEQWHSIRLHPEYLSPAVRDGMVSCQLQCDHRPVKIEVMASIPSYSNMRLAELSATAIEEIKYRIKRSINRVVHVAWWRKQWHRFERWNGWQ